jgi:hypothetical protein
VLTGRDLRTGRIDLAAQESLVLAFPRIALSAEMPGS